VFFWFERGELNFDGILKVRVAREDFFGRVDQDQADNLVGIVMREEAKQRSAIRVSHHHEGARDSC
jgi:hypothetical protein